MLSEGSRLSDLEGTQRAVMAKLFLAVTRTLLAAVLVAFSDSEVLSMASLVAAARPSTLHFVSPLVFVHLYGTDGV